MSALDPKAVAQRQFAKPDSLARSIDVISRFATDPPLTIRALLDAVEERTGADGRIAELGFGSGWLLDELIPRFPQAALYGLDLSPGNAGAAHRSYADRVRLIVGDIERLPFRDASLDVAVSCWTLYFMRDIDAALGEIRRCLRPGGRLIAATSAADHEIEMNELAAQAVRSATGREPAAGIGARFDLASGEAHMRRAFSRVEVREWRGEMVLPELEYVLALWPKWQPPGLDGKEAALAFDEFERLAAGRLTGGGPLRIRRHECMFVGDME